MAKTTIIILTLASLFAAFGQLFFKIGATGKSSLTGFINGHILAGFILYGAGSALWVYVMSLERLSKVYPFTALTFVLVILMSAFYLKEKLGINTVMGLTLVLIGLALISRDG